jgi:chloramphenicol 3-O phosphotransferase
MPVRVIVLNGGSSSGKSSLARCLQSLLPDPWLMLGVDTLMEAMPAALWGSDAGVVVASDGQITVGPVVRALEAAWACGVAAIAHAGAGIILDQVFLGGGAAQERWRVALDGLSVLWVGVKCDPNVAATRESARGDRVRGMAASQAVVVHAGVVYDIEVDTAHDSPEICAQRIVDRVLSRMS